MGVKRFELCGTSDNAMIWCSHDSTGVVFSLFVWSLFLFMIYVIVDIITGNYIDTTNAAIVLFLVFMAMWSHLKTMFSDPGVVPSNAHPLLSQMDKAPEICGRCDGYKPRNSHHDRVSNRCISRMDHFCPWTNNSIGAKNQKAFFLFLIYTDLAAVYLYAFISLHLLYCDSLGCDEFTGQTLLLARIGIFVLLFGILFTSSMIINQVYGLVTGVGTIDRMKLKSDYLPQEDTVPFNHVFGDEWWTHWLPIDPTFSDPEAVFHYRLCEESYSSVV